MNKSEPDETDSAVVEGATLLPRRWPRKTIIEILPVVIALTVFFSYRTIQQTEEQSLVSSPITIMAAVPLWVTVLMGLILLVGCLGMGWLLYLLFKAPVVD